jgi:tetratricopeptide (TPR) repeat protein
VTVTGHANDGASEPLADAISAAWNFGDPGASEARFRALAGEHAARGDMAGAGQLMTQVARAQGLAGRFTEAHATLDGVAATAEAAQPVLQVRCLLERGRVFNSSMEPERARPLFEQAWSLARTAGMDALAADAAHMVALTYMSTPERALEWNEIGLELARASRDPRARRWLGPLLNNQGWTRFEREEYPLALALFEEALEFRSQQDDGDPANWRATRIAGWCVAKTLRMLDRPAEALARLEALRAEYDAAGQVSGFVFEELGECEHLLGASERARSHFARAHAELSKDSYLAAAEPARLQRLGQLGGVL